jgi:hypothetical protein
VVVSPNIPTQATIEFLSQERAIYKGSDLGSSAVIFNVQEQRFGLRIFSKSSTLV